MSRLCLACVCLACVTLPALLVAAPAAAQKRVVTVTAAQAKAKGLPPFGIKLELAGGGLSASRLPARHVYLRLSGPPGGPLGLQISASRTANTRPKWIGQLVQREVPDRRLGLGAKATLTISGHKHPAIAYTTGASLARAHGCLVWLWGAPSSSQDGLLVRFWSSAGKTKHPGCAALARQAPFPALLSSLKIERE